VRVYNENEREQTHHMGNKFDFIKSLGGPV